MLLALEVYPATMLEACFVVTPWIKIRVRGDHGRCEWMECQALVVDHGMSFEVGGVVCSELFGRRARRFHSLAAFTRPHS